MRREQVRDDVGRAEILPAEPVAAGGHGHWQVRYTCGEAGVRPDGCLRVTVPYGFTAPQTEYRSAEGFVVADCSNPDVVLHLSTQDPKGGRNEGVWGRHLFICIMAKPLVSGDTVRLDYGRGDGGGLTNAGARARSFEGPAEFTVAVDPDGTRSAPAGGFHLVSGDQPSVRVSPGRACRLQVTSPSMARPSEEIVLRIGARDRYGNSARDLEGDLVVSLGISGAGKVTARMAKGKSKVKVRLPESRGALRIRCQSADGSISGVSNPCRVTDRQDRTLCWGDLHVMTGISAGLGRPGDALRYARDEAQLDFCAVTDGDDADGYYSDAEWEETRSAVRDYDDPGRFVTLLASEYHERRVAGDKNIYYRSDDAALLRWSDLSGDQPEALWQALKGTRALTVPHHVCSGSAGMKPWDHHDPAHQRLVEIYSVWGSSEAELLAAQPAEQRAGRAQQGVSTGDPGIGRLARRPSGQLGVAPGSPGIPKRAGGGTCRGVDPGGRVRRVVGPGVLRDHG
jgi:hypothetical protein